MKRTDLAVELSSKTDEKGISLQKETRFGTEVTIADINRNGEKLTGKPAGRYVTVHCGRMPENKAQTASAVAWYLSDFLKNIAPWETVITVGLGNDNITPDSLGVRTVRKIPATAHLAKLREFHELAIRPVMSLETGVMAQTGIESAEQLYCIARHILPSAVIAIDSLACSERERLAATIQLTDTGIALGSGIGNNRKRLAKSTLDVPVIAIGVPTVFDYDEDEKESFMVTPRDIDAVVKHFSDIIALAVNSVLNPSLSPEEIESLRV